MTYETLLVGLVLALLYTEIMGYSPGGIVVPGYIALYLDQPLRVLGTLAAAGVTVLAFRLLSRRFILFGRRRFVFMILFGAVLAQSWALVAPRIFPGSLELRVIGWVIPGLLASNLDRQKPAATIASLATVSVATYFLVRIVS